MKFEVGPIDESIMNGVSESDRCRLRGMWFWVKDDLDGSRVVGVHEDEINFGVCQEHGIFLNFSFTTFYDSLLALSSSTFFSFSFTPQRQDNMRAIDPKT